jgi:hypothetical protein
MTPRNGPLVHLAQGGESTKKGECQMEIKRSGSRPSAKGSADWFTGSVRVDPLFQAPDPARVAGASVTFEPELAPRGIRIPWNWRAEFHADREKECPNATSKTSATIPGYSDI